MIARARDPQDRRRHVVSITDTGRRELARIRVIVTRLEDEFLAPLGAADREALHSMLVALAALHDPGCCPLDEAEAL
jgi:DNA-binding MarR family transcriptional regulator